jgi:hypothetical protein
MSFRRVLFAASLPLLLAACNGGGTVALELTDAPPDLATLKQVNVTIRAVEVHVAGGSSAADDEGAADKSAPDDKESWQTVTENAGTFDLLALQNDVTAPLGEIDLPDGKITQIRLHIDPDGKNEVIQADGQTCALDLTNVDSTGIKINQAFKALDVPQGGRLKVVVDFDIKESVDRSGDCAYTLNPVLKIKKTAVE